MGSKTKHGFNSVAGAQLILAVVEAFILDGFYISDSMQRAVVSVMSRKCECDFVFQSSSIGRTGENMAGCDVQRSIRVAGREK